MKVAIGADHAGFELKEVIKKHLNGKGIEYIDYGTSSTKSVDYTGIGLKVSEAAASGTADRGILICGTGIGMSIVANKVKGIRAALCHDVFSASATRSHNDSNVLTIGSRVIGEGLALMIVDTWIDTGFEGGRHQNRIDNISEFEKEGN